MLPPVTPPRDPYAVTPSDPLHGWPPPERPPWWHPRAATGADWAVVLLGPGSALLLLLAGGVPEGDLGEALSAAFALLCAGIAGLIALVLYFVRLFSPPWPPWLGTFVAGGAAAAVWVFYGFIPYLT